MNNKLIRVLALAVIVVIFSAAASPAQWGDKGGRREGGKDFGQFLARKLNLSDGQAKEFKAAEEKIKPEVDKLRGKMAELGKKLREALQKENPSADELHRCIREINKIRTEMEIRRTDLMLDLQKRLTPEQKIEFKKMLGRRFSPGRGQPSR